MPALKLGKQPAKKDERNFKMANILAIDEAALPRKYDVDASVQNIPTPMFANDEHGCCVISGRAHQTLRFEKIEQKKLITIKDSDVLKEWRIENGNTEDGLYILDSIKLWRKKGWKVGRKNYKIKAFAEINTAKKSEIKNAIYKDLGVVIGVAMPDSWLEEFEAGDVWSDIRGEPNPYNGHCVYVTGYDTDGLTCVTWGRKQKMTWEWFFKYCDEAYGVFDARNSSAALLDILDDMLAKVEHDAS